MQEGMQEMNGNLLVRIFGVQMHQKPHDVEQVMEMFSVNDMR
jgi:hypothetical protein